jgi:endonuclease YncB( thermonuclease family)
MTGCGQRIDIIMVKTDKSMMKTSLIIVFSVFLLLVFGCKMQVDNIQSGDKGVEGAQDVISFKGRVVYRTFEGGFWGIISDDGQRYDPLVLPEQFRIEGMRVEGKVRRRNVAHFHMWGIIVELVELKIIEEGVSPAIKELIDGFTYQLKDGKVVRLIGINSNKNAQEAAELLKKNKLINSSVKLEFDERQTDDQGRLLAYVFADLFCQGGASSILVHGMKVAHFIPHAETVLLNEMLIKAGYAEFESQPPNVKYNERFRKARNEAAAKKRGLWKNEQSIKHEK